MTLEGKSILVTRAREQSKELAEAFRRLGAEVVCQAYIEIQFLPLDIPDLSTFDVLVLTSRNAVEAFFAADPALYEGLRVLCVGKKTAQFWQEKRPNIVPMIPKQFSNEGIIQWFEMEYKEFNNLRVYCPQARQARGEYVQFLEERGASPVVAEAYSIEKLRPTELPPANIDYVSFMSGRSVEAFMEAVPAAHDYLKTRKTVVIGPVTNAKARALGLEVDLMPDQATFEELVKVVENDVRKRS